MKEAILDGVIRNEHDECLAFLQEEWKKTQQIEN